MALSSFAWNLKPIFWMKAIEMFTNDLNRIIKNSPPLRKKLVVFRGVKTDYYLTGSKNKFYKNQGFVSTSLSYRLSRNFAGGKCCLKRIVLLPGTKCLFISGLSRFPNEIEILLPTNSIFYVQNAKRSIAYYESEDIKIDDVCAKKGVNTLYVTDIIVVS
jgi:hypothetical protein